jgi:hypothetical protein
MYGQSWDQGSDASTGSRTEPAFFQSPSPVSGSNRSGNRQQTKSAPNRRPGMKPEIPEVGTMLLAVYETAKEYRAGILLVEAAVEIEASDPDTGDSDSRAGNWLGRVAELQLEHDHQPGEALQWAQATELASDKILYSEVLVYKLKSEHVAACRSLVSRLQSIAQMLEMSRGGD